MSLPKPTRRGRKTSKRRKSRLALRKECDRRFALAIKNRDNWTCQMCGSKTGIQCSHLISRRYHATRWLMGNAVAQCARCHLRSHMDPLMFDAWVEAKIGFEAFHELKILARKGVTWIDYEQVLASLPEVCK